MIRRLRAAAAELLGLFVSGWLETAVAVALVAGALLAARSDHRAWVGFALAGALSVELLAVTILSRTRG